MAAAGLAAIYALVIALGDVRAWSGSDAGGKVATVKVMAEEGSWVPDVGYWAERWDPDGRFHPLLYTKHVDDNWVQATSLTYTYLGVPLWHVAGPAGLLLLPLVGSVGAAVMARRLAQTLGAQHGWLAFWVVGIGTPVLFYAGDYWEHSLGVALGVAATDVALRARNRWSAVAAGVLFGLAATVRTEMLVYAAVFGLVSLVVAEERRRWLSRALLGPIAAAAAVAVVGTATFAEQEVIGRSVRGAIVSSNAELAGSHASTRIRDAATTTFALFSDDTARSIVAGLLLLVVLGAAGYRLGRKAADDGPTRVLLGVSSALVLARVVNGLGFVPGMFPAAPAAALATGLAPSAGRRARLVAGVALVAVPLIWYVEPQGQLVAQWGGRYLLLSGVLLTVVAAVAVEERPVPTATRALMVALPVSVTLLGAAWHIDRTRSVADSIRAIESVSEDVVVVSGIAHLAREGGAFYGDHRWLTAAGPADLADAVEVARRAGVERIDVVDFERREVDDGFAGLVLRGQRDIDFLGFTLVARRFVVPSR